MLKGISNFQIENTIKDKWCRFSRRVSFILRNSRGLFEVESCYYWYCDGIYTGKKLL